MCLLLYLPYSSTKKRLLNESHVIYFIPKQRVLLYNLLNNLHLTCMLMPTSLACGIKNIPLCMKTFYPALVTSSHIAVVPYTGLASYKTRLLSARWRANILPFPWQQESFFLYVAYFLKYNNTVLFIVPSTMTIILLGHLLSLHHKFLKITKHVSSLLLASPRAPFQTKIWRSSKVYHGLVILYPTTPSLHFIIRGRLGHEPLHEPKQAPKPLHEPKQEHKLT